MQTETNDSRGKRTDKVNALCQLLEWQKASKYPDEYNVMIKRLKWELVGLYKKALNTRKPIDTETRAGV